MRKSFFIPLIILYLVSSCKKENEKIYAMPIPVTQVPVDTTAAKSYLALGDSYTIGQSVEIADRFPVQTVKLLADQGIKFNTPEIIAQTGWTTANLINAIATSAPLKKQYDIVTLLIGVNNQYQHKTLQEYTDQFLNLLTTSIQYACNNKMRVIVLSIPDYSVTPFANNSDKVLIAKELDQFNEINKKIADQYGVNYLNITNFTRAAMNDLSFVANDGLHPSGLEYKIWADALVPIIKKALL